MKLLRMFSLSAFLVHESVVDQEKPAQAVESPNPVSSQSNDVQLQNAITIQRGLQAYFEEKQPATVKITQSPATTLQL